MDTFQIRGRPIWRKLLSEGSLSGKIAELRALLRADQDWRERCQLLTRLGLALQECGDPGQARQAFFDSLGAIPADYEHAPLLRGQVLRNLSALERDQGQRDLARNYAAQAIALFELSGNDEGVALTLVDLGLLNKDQSRLAESLAGASRAGNHACWMGSIRFQTWAMLSSAWGCFRKG